MVDITHKNTTLRVAIAEALVEVGTQDTITAINEGRVPKGDVFEMSKAAGLLGVKKTPELLPDCHPILIEYTGFDFSIEEKTIRIRCTVKAIYKTGVEVEAMHGASIAALNLYDMLKPLDKAIEIKTIRLVEKKGGKSDRSLPKAHLKAQVIICSDSVSSGQAQDSTGIALNELLKETGLEVHDVKVIADEHEQIRKAFSQAIEQETDLIIFSGGTGASPRDITADVLDELIEKRLPGVEEAMRSYGQQRTPVAMFSRSVAGLVKQSIVLALPGSKSGALDSMAAVFPTVLHLVDVLKGKRHD